MVDEIRSHADDLQQDGLPELSAVEPVGEDDVIVEFAAMHHGKHDKNPVDAVCVAFFLPFPSFFHLLFSS